MDDNTYERKRSLAKSWDSKDLRTGSLDCCAFVDSIARAAGLKTASEKYLYPQDHLLRHKQIN